MCYFSHSGCFACGYLTASHRAYSIKGFSSGGSLMLFYPLWWLRVLSMPSDGYWGGLAVGVWIAPRPPQLAALERRGEKRGGGKQTLCGIILPPLFSAFCCVEMPRDVFFESVGCFPLESWDGDTPHVEFSRVLRPADPPWYDSMCLGIPQAFMGEVSVTPAGLIPFLSSTVYLVTQGTRKMPRLEVCGDLGGSAPS